MSKQWQNWSGSVSCSPTKIVYPSSEREIVSLVKECRTKNLKLRVVGSGHSFTPLVKTNDYLLSLDKYSGIEKIDKDKQQVTVRIGMKIKALGEALFHQGMAQPNLGDIDVQSIGGAISTGTHGSGIAFGSISTQVIGLTLITVNGEILECSEECNREIFKAAQVSIGVLGIISKVTLQLVPAYKLHYTWCKMSLDDCLTNLEKYKQENRNFEFFWFPYTNSVLAKFMNVTDRPALKKNFLRQFNELAFENGILWLLSKYALYFPSQSVQVSRLLASLLSNGSDINYSHKIFATPRLVKFQEMEYSLPSAYFVNALQKIRTCMEQELFQIHFPIECRFVKGDDIFISPANGRDSAYIAVHVFKGMEYHQYFKAVEEIFCKYEGRPHWGKIHGYTTNNFQELYPMWEKFQAVRRSLDPDSFWLNDHLKKILQ